MNRSERRQLGAHYTNEANILKTIQPLFLDGLWDDFNKLKARKDTRRKVELARFQDRLGELTFLILHVVAVTFSLSPIENCGFWKSRSCGN